MMGCSEGAAISFSKLTLYAKAGTAGSILAACATCKAPSLSSPRSSLAMPRLFSRYAWRLHPGPLRPKMWYTHGYPSWILPILATKISGDETSGFRGDLLAKLLAYFETQVYLLLFHAVSMKQDLLVSWCVFVSKRHFRIILHGQLESCPCFLIHPQVNVGITCHRMW